jgi:predicted DNA-binding ribbon-helix-helix protein
MKCKSPVVKRSVVIAKHKTSVSVEDLFWSSLKKIAAEANVTISDLVAKVDHGRADGNLSSALRTFVLGYYRDRCGEGDLAKADARVSTVLALNGNNSRPMHRLDDRVQMAGVVLKN